MHEGENGQDMKPIDQPAPPTGQPVMPPNNFWQAEADERDLKSARSLMTAANILGPVSIFIGGVLASIAGLVCGFLARGKLKRLMESKRPVAHQAGKLERSCNIALIVCGVALVLNAIFLVMTVITFVEMLDNGELAKLLAQNLGTASPQGSSTWG